MDPSPVAPPIMAPPVTAPPSGLAVAALVTGIAAFVMACIPFVSFIAFLPALAAGGLGIAALVRKAGRGKAVTGLVLGTLAFFIAIAVSAALVGAVSTTRVPVADGNEEVPVASSPSAEPSSTPTEEAPAPVTVPADKTYQGSGDSVVSIELPDGPDSASAATISHVGSSNFAVWALDSNMEQLDLLVNEIGNYKGTVLLNLSGNTPTSLEITADGPWTVTLHSILSLREFTGATAKGVGDDVLVYRGKAGVASITHDGSSNFAVWNYGDRSDLVVNEIGQYSGDVRWSSGPSVVAITADGNWSITVK
ncbi:hypothetical protein BKA04_000423 [Cryobacterium mesophilum]|uniref:DUF4190 domain-containing protein n=1 Tax=Terrimesophilobacter mesophilus TaxID=433647 RepID=A0A4R8V7F7_9MICO|nr:DUF4190 domain-containing protein [Terrimesophilobacter mesophilus]MBB5632200.1 hypothetical protein [Terrimesophilobacter mesophilus]TFB79061.1 DUF4190 domain-containing protein [Terrimesophilobacter mesophilus]